MIKEENNNTILSGVYILLGNFLMYKNHYEKLSPSEKEDFDELPINYLLIKMKTNIKE